MSSIHAWDNFFVAEVGAAAALTGLVFVAVSISLRTILALDEATDTATRATSSDCVRETSRAMTSSSRSRWRR